MRGPCPDFMPSQAAEWVGCPQRNRGCVLAAAKCSAPPNMDQLALNGALNSSLIDSKVKAIRKTHTSRLPASSPSCISLPHLARQGEGLSAGSEAETGRRPAPLLSLCGTWTCHVPSGPPFALCIMSLSHPPPSSSSGILDPSLASCPNPCL